MEPSNTRLPPIMKHLFIPALHYFISCFPLSRLYYVSKTNFSSKSLFCPSLYIFWFSFLFPSPSPLPSVSLSVSLTNSHTHIHTTLETIWQRNTLPRGVYEGNKGGHKGKLYERGDAISTTRLVNFILLHIYYTFGKLPQNKVICTHAFSSQLNFKKFQGRDQASVTSFALIESTLDTF